MFQVLLPLIPFPYLSGWDPAGNNQPRLVMWQFGSEFTSNIRVMANSYTAFEIQTNVPMNLCRD
jgi:hypothetical protein